MFVFMSKEEVCAWANLWFACFLLAVKSKDSDEIQFTARYEIGAWKEIVKYYLFNRGNVLQECFTRLFLLIAAEINFLIRSTGIKFA